MNTFFNLEDLFPRVIIINKKNSSLCILASDLIVLVYNVWDDDDDVLQGQDNLHVLSLVQSSVHLQKSRSIWA